MRQASSHDFCLGSRPTDDANEISIGSERFEGVDGPVHPFVLRQPPEERNERGRG